MSRYHHLDQPVREYWTKAQQGELDRQKQEFLAGGGTIKQIDPGASGIVISPLALKPGRRSKLQEAHANELRFEMENYE